MIDSNIHPVCSICGKPATSELRLIPKRTDAPISSEIRKALDWPDTELATSVSTCRLHREAFRQAARTVIAETVGDDQIVFRKVVGGPDD